MHRLMRGKVPQCLKGFTHHHHTWSDVTSRDRSEIWIALDFMQGQRCAYCEAKLSESARHIEHFIQRNSITGNPSLMFAWTNLFGSCNRQEFCGKHKDMRGRPYNSTDLIKPDEEDPEDYLVFDGFGSVRPKHGLSVTDDHRARETIRVFNLDCRVLQAIRRSELAGYVQTAETFAEMAEQFPREEWLPLLYEEIEATSHQPYATAIKHVLARQS